MSKSVKIDESIREWDGYALFDKDNVLSTPMLYENLDTAKADASEGDDVWNVTLTRVSKAEATQKPVNKRRIARKLTPVLLELTTDDIFAAAIKEA
jgi:hypothetical protein